MNTPFHEQQKFTQGWLWLIVIGVLLLSLYGLYQQFIVGVPFGDQPMSNAELALFSISMLSAPALIAMMQLNTEIDNHEIRMAFVPFVKKRIRWDDIKQREVVDYGFVGGWGIRPWTRYGTVYNTRGRHGLAIELRNGKKLLIGTQKIGELTAFIKNCPHTAD